MDLVVMNGNRRNHCRYLYYAPRYTILGYIGLGTGTGKTGIGIGTGTGTGTQIESYPGVSDKISPGLG